MGAGIISKYMRDLKTIFMNLNEQIKKNLAKIFQII